MAPSTIGKLSAMARSLLGLFLMVILGSLAVSAARPPDAEARLGCGTIPSTSIYARARVVAIRGVSCATARRVALTYDRGVRSPRGWGCFLAHSDLPRIFSCGSGENPGGGDVRGSSRAFEVIGVRATRRAATTASAAYARRCGDFTEIRGGLYEVSTKNITCAAARRTLRRFDYVGSGPRPRLPGWRCRTVGRYQEGATLRCTRSNRGIRFTSGG